jgi:glyoxylase-like metal-dependent hydrolase (beta-lactamase superfamily II)
VSPGERDRARSLRERRKGRRALNPLPNPPRRYEVLATPGHSPDHVSLLCRSSSALFSGDVFLTPETFFFRSDEDWAAIERTLAGLLEVDGWDALLCGHMPVYEGGRAAVEKKLE